jgi:hypothetical protein
VGDPPVDVDPDGLPADVVEWLGETYTSQGVAIWRDAYRRADEERKQRMLRVSRIDPMGT